MYLTFVDIAASLLLPQRSYRVYSIREHDVYPGNRQNGVTYNKVSIFYWKEAKDRSKGRSGKVRIERMDRSISVYQAAIKQLLMAVSWERVHDTQRMAEHAAEGANSRGTTEKMRRVYVHAFLRMSRVLEETNGSS
jgi:hypothetical protein